MSAAPQIVNRHTTRRIGGAGGARARHDGEEIAHLASLAGATPVASATRAACAENCSSRPSQARARPLSSASAAVRMPAATEALRPAICSASPHWSTRALRCGPTSCPENTARSAAAIRGSVAASEILGQAGLQAERGRIQDLARHRARRHVERDERCRPASPRPSRSRHARPKRARSAYRPTHRQSDGRCPRRRHRSAGSAAPPDW